MKKTKGKLIVVDGSDGSGKSTQVGLLIERLKKEGHKVEMVDFPEYKNNFFGSFVGECLSEEEYNWLHVHPKIAAPLSWRNTSRIRLSASRTGSRRI